MRAAFIVDDFIIDPLGIGYLSSYLKAAGHEVDLIKTNDPDFNNIVNYPPDLLCYSVTTGKHRGYFELNRLIRQSVNGAVHSVFGGPHVTFFPDFSKQQFVDIGIRGEGFDAIVDVANAFEMHRSIRTHEIMSPSNMGPFKENTSFMFSDRCRKSL